MSEPRTEAGERLLALLERWAEDEGARYTDENRRDDGALIVAIEDEARAPALALLRLLGADRECERGSVYTAICRTHRSVNSHVGSGAASFPLSAARCEVGAAWDALEADR